MTFQEALYALGVRENTLSDEESSDWIKMDFSPFRTLSLLSWSFCCGPEMEALFALDSTGEPGMPKECTNMQNRSFAFDVCFTHPRLLAAVAHVLKADFRSLGIHSRPQSTRGRSPTASCRLRRTASQTGLVFCMQLNVDVDRLHQENGPTRVVPGSHRSGKHPQDVMKAPEEAHPDEINLIGTAGTVVVFNSHLWHGLR